MKVRALVVALLVAGVLGVADVSGQEVANKKTTNYSLFDGQLTVAIPKAATAPRKLNSKTYQVRPKSQDKKFVLYVMKEGLLQDEVGKSNKQLASSVKSLLEAQGYEVIQLRNSGDTFTADFRSYSYVPWQKVGTSPVRGTAKFVRTKSNELIGSILMCDPPQWTDTSIAPFKKAVAGASVAK